MDDQCGIFADEAEIPLFCIENAEQVDAMSLHCIGRRNVESIVWSAWGSVGANPERKTMRSKSSTGHSLPTAAAVSTMLRGAITGIRKPISMTDRAVA